MKFQIKNSIRLVVLSGLVVASLSLLNGCGESEPKEEPAETVAPAPDPVIVDSIAITDSGRVIDARKPEAQ